MRKFSVLFFFFFRFSLLFLIQMNIARDDLTSSLSHDGRVDLVGVDHFNTEYIINAFTCCQAMNLRGNYARQNCELDGSH